MKFNKMFEEKRVNGFTSTFKRKAVRAVIMQNHKILLVQSNKGDYKFPGGGVEQNERNAEALVREIREETGYINCKITNWIGTIVERRIDVRDVDKLFEMTSHYYIGTLADEEKIPQQLDDYENVLDFTPKWVLLDEAILQNEHLIEQIERNSWLKRETYMLKRLKNA